ncbi:MAG: hypothetical protein R3E42_19835 [Burkholderiaceae bacterium]
MNIQRFIAATSREAMAKARHTFGDSAVILSSRATDEGFEVMAAAEESLAPSASGASTTSLASRSDRLPPSSPASPRAPSARLCAARRRSILWRATPRPCR